MRSRPLAVSLLASVLACAIPVGRAIAQDASDPERALRARVEAAQGKERGAAAAELAGLLEKAKRWSEAASAWREARRLRGDLADVEGEARALLAFAEEVAASDASGPSVVAAFEDARNALRHAREAGSASLDVALGLARCAEMASDPDAQLAEVRGAVQKWSSDPRATDALAAALSSAPAGEELLQLAAKLSEASPQHAGAALVLSRTALAAGKEDLAKAGALRAIEANTENAEAWNALYRIYGPKQRWGEFADAAVGVAKTHPKSGYAAYYAGTGCISARRFDEALGWLESAWTLNPRAYQAKTEAARILFSEKKDREGAIRLATDVLAADPKNADASRVLFFVGTLFYREGNPKASVPIFETIARARPDDPVAQNNLANTYRFAGRYADSERVYLASIEKSPTDAQLRNDYALLLEVEGRVEESRKVLLAAHEVDPTNNDSMENLAFLARAKGDRDEALKWFRAAYANAAARGELVGRHRITVDDVRWPLPPLPMAR